MFCKAPILPVLFLCAILSSCRTVVKFSTDGSLTEHAVIVITPKDPAPGEDTRQAFAARQACKGAVNFTVPRSRARSTFVASLVPDYRQEGNDIRRFFVPAETKALIFSQEGITARPRKGR